jgi:hypothetical protein
MWFVAGTAAGVYASTRARRAAEALTLDGIHDRLTGWFAGAAVLREELRAGMHEKESELRDRLHLGSQGLPELTAAPEQADQASRVAPVRRLSSAPSAGRPDAAS